MRQGMIQILTQADRQNAGFVQIKTVGCDFRDGVLVRLAFIHTAKMTFYPCAVKDDQTTIAKRISSEKKMPARFLAAWESLERTAKMLDVVI
jgi:hypothetical protein